MDKETFTKKLFIAIYLTLEQFNLNEISLIDKDLKEYVPRLKKLLEENINTDIFVQTPVEETFDAYKDFLINILYNNNLGYFNPNYNKLILNAPKFYIYKCQKEMIEYRDLILKCCYIITKDTHFIEDDTIYEILCSTSQKLTKIK